MRRFVLRVVALAGVLLAAAAALVAALNLRDEAPLPDGAPPFRPTAEQVQRGAYLARAGNCVSCHTRRGGAPYAGGRPVPTPFGTVYSSNLTPDAGTGIGRWTPAHFWRALHNGRSRDGRLLYPAFPYTEYTLVARDDADALYAYLMSLPAVREPQRAHELRFPYDSQLALAVWRALFFRPGAFVADPQQSPQWNRGAYLVRGLAHCTACHGERNVFGATTGGLHSGGVLPGAGWYAPSLASGREAGLADWAVDDIVALLKTGRAARGSVMGPMAEVVFRGTQHLDDADLRAMAVFLKRLPASEPAPQAFAPPDAAVRARGRLVYEETCARCHGKQGEGKASAYPALAGSRAVNMERPDNLIRIVLGGGYLPATAGNPRPYGMPPYAHVLDDAAIAAALSYVRSAWGNAARPVLQREVMRYRAGAIE